MILDLRLESVPKRWEAEVVIVGAGPAGLTLARELSKVCQVLLIECGGLSSDPEQEALLTGECAGLPYPLTTTRARQFGGSSGLWAGYCAQFDEHDFAPREWVPRSGWPFGAEAIQPYYDRVAELLNLGAPDFDALHLAQCSGSEMPFVSKALVPTVWRFGNPTQRFGESSLEEFAASEQVVTLTNASVTNIKVDGDQSGVTELIIRTLNGREGSVSGRTFILACGGIETPRLLLNSDLQISHGLGNSSDMVGRCFMEHPHRTIDPLLIERLDWFEKWTERLNCDRGNKQFTFCVGLSRSVQESAGVMNARAHIYRTPKMRDDETPKVGLFLEQAPNLASRVRLSNRRDLLGLRRVQLDWHLSELDRTTYLRTASYLAGEFERIGAGHLTAPIEERQDRDQVLYSNHHLGTTRMAERREDGVVDSNCRVFDLGNLYVISGSIFPTVSWANPTFTLLALTFRLAEHLKTVIGHKPIPRAI